MKQLLRWPIQELPSLSFVTLYGLLILSATGAGVGKAALFLVLQVVIYLASIIGHEFAHLLLAMAFGTTVTLRLLPRPTVTCSNMTPRAARLIALAGPLAGMAISISGLCLLVVLGGFSPLLYAIAGALSLMHLVMLLPQYADGQMLRTKLITAEGQKL